jgi:carbamate kinase
MRATAQVLAAVARRYRPLVLTHGNGPQVGLLLRQAELGAREVPAPPLDVLDAETQGQIGYLIQSELEPALTRARTGLSVLVIVSRTEVLRRDPAFRRPTKPVGRFYAEHEARLLRKQFGWSMVHDPARGGWRRLVPSPKPVRWLEGSAVRRLLRSPAGRSCVLVVSGGGGIPVVRRGRSGYAGVEAVIDKDRAAALVAHELSLPTFVVVTDVPGAAIAFGRPGERWLGKVGRKELEQQYEAGEFAEGSMGPKVEAGLEFLRAGGRRFIITDIPSLGRALEGRAGTHVY